jgi:FMN phosphatase YigB (HAD superfamily)
LRADIRHVVTDLDNTLYDWVDFYVPSLLAMIGQLSLLTGISEEDLKGSFKRLHEKYGTSEYSFAIFQLDVLQQINKSLSARQILEKYDSAIHAFRSSRKRTLRLFEGVKETLVELRSRGKQLVAHTDALMFHAIARLKRLGIEDLFSAICAPPDHGLPNGVSIEDVRYFSDESRYETSIPLRLESYPDIRKPDPRALQIVLDRLGANPRECVYIGDSVTRDVLMAQRCGVFDVLAEYGRGSSAANYTELVKITYWTGERITDEESLKSTSIVPSFVIGSFSEILDVIGRLESMNTE